MNEIDEEEYYNIGKSENLPKRCPILDKCERRMWTLYFLGKDREEYPKNTEEELFRFLKSEKGINGINKDTMVKLRGEGPMTVEHEHGMGFSYMCPEVILFERHRFMYDIPRIAATNGRFNHKEKEKGYYCQHYSECAEFSAYFFEVKHGRKVKLVEARQNFIYLMKNQVNGYFKIGRSNDPRYREKTLQSQEPDVELIEKWEAETDEEKILHKKFKEKRVRGEWFSLNEADIEYIIEYMSNKVK